MPQETILLAPERTEAVGSVVDNMHRIKSHLLELISTVLLCPLEQDVYKYVHDRFSNPNAIAKCRVCCRRHSYSYEKNLSMMIKSRLPESIKEGKSRIEIHDSSTSIQKLI